MKTLIIHPKDNSTVFLETIYEKIDNKTVIQSNFSKILKQEVFELIKTHDRIMMMGHGSPEGLFSVGNFNTDNGYVIDKNFVPFLKKKKNVFIFGAMLISLLKNIN